MSDEFKNAQQILVMTENEFEKRIERALQRVIEVQKKPPEFIGESVALSILGLRSKTSLFHLRQSGAISYSKMGKIILYRRSSLIKYIERNEHKTF